MVNIKQHFEDFRNNTPKHVQWLLMGVAFLVVIILLTLLLTAKSKKTTDVSVSEVNQPVSFEVEPETVKLQDIKVGTSSSEIVTISVDSPIVITSVEIDAEGFSVPNDCTDTVVDSACTIKVVYKPAKANDKAKTKITVTWHIKDREENLKTEEIPVLYSAFEEKVEPVEVVEPEQEPEQVEEDEEDFVFEDEPEMDVKEELTQIAVPNPFVDNTTKEVAPLVPPKKCSEFAIPGYDVAGNQIGWIKPEHGANYFYPFADKECANPTGKYNPETGVITSLSDGSKIGTDSDHIGYRKVRDRNFALPKLSLPKIGNASFAKNGQFDSNAEWGVGGSTYWSGKKFDKTATKQIDRETLMGSGAAESVTSSRPYDRTFILRQFKPIPATIVSEVRADPSVYGCNKGGQNCKDEKNYSIPVRATVDRNVYSDDGRTIILPAGTLLMGYLSGDLPGPYQAFGRMNIKWYQFIRPDGVEFNFEDGQDPYSGDAQGRMGVPGHGSTDYVEQMVMPILTSLVPAAVNMIAPITDTVINQIDLDNNTIVQSGTIRSSEMAKQDIINTWNKITQKLLVDSIDNTVPPFSIAAGTRINVFSPVDLIVSCEDVAGKKCSVITYGDNPRRKWSELKNEAKFVENDDPSWIGQIRSFDLTKYCAYDEKKNKVTVGNNWDESGYDYRTVLAYCESQNYQAINNAKQAAYNKQVQAQAQEKRDEYGATWTQEDGWTTNFADKEAEKEYNTEVLGLQYDDEDNIINPFSKTVNSAQDDMLTCDDGKAPDENGCCTGEIFTDMGEDGWNCCPDTGGDCFPPLTME